MTAFIEIFPFFIEKRIPYISLTRSKEGKNGSASFLFIKPEIFKKSKNHIKSLNLIYENQKIYAKFLKVFFYKGKPFSLQAIFLFTNQEEYFLFLKFLCLYSKKNNLTYFKYFDK